MPHRGYGSATIAADQDEIVKWAATLHCPFCGDGMVVGISERRTRIDVQCGDCGFVWSVTQPEVRRLWRTPAYRSAMIAQSTVDDMVRRGVR